MKLVNNRWRIFGAAFRLELRQLRRARLFVFLVLCEAATFLVLVTMFGLTGSRAPTAIIDSDHTSLSQSFIRDLAHDHDSFRLEYMNLTDAQQQLKRGEIVAVIVIPNGFSSLIKNYQTPVIKVTIDNVNTDFTEDIRRAIPSAIATFAKEQHLPHIRAVYHEVNLIHYDTGYIPYLAVSALCLDAMIVASVMAAIAMAREWEGGTMMQLRMSAASKLFLFGGKLFAVMCVSLIATFGATLLVVLGYHIRPLYPAEVFGGLLLAVIIFTAFGAAIGSMIKKVLPVASLLFGLTLPLYIISGALEPIRFDGNALWYLAHFTPVYPAVGILEHAFHGFQVTPESIRTDVVMLCAWGVASIVLSAAIIRKKVFDR